MISRLVLVSIVAVLGVSLPSRLDCEEWFTSVRTWAIAQLANWDTCTSKTSRDGGSSIVWRAPTVPRFRPARTTASVAVACEPIPVVEGLGNGIADELNRMAEGWDAPPSSLMSEGASADFSPISAGDSIELKMAFELCRLAENSMAGEAVCSRSMKEEREDVYEMTDEVLASDIQPESLANAKRLEFEPIEPIAGLAMGTADALNRAADGLEVVAAGVAARTVQAPTIEPIDVPADLESGTAYELNRQADGLSIARFPTSGPANQAEARRTHDDSSFGNALRLTREAAFAWANLLTGPPPVEMTAR